MKVPTHLLPLLLLLLVSGLVSSCIQSSTVIRVRKDGAGEIFARYYFSPQMLEMVERMQTIAARTGDPAAANFAVLRNVEKPDEDMLAADSTAFGHDLHYLRHSIEKNSDGWIGYLVVYQFDDIENVKIDSNSVPGQIRAFARANNPSADKPQGGQYRFQMADGKLTVQSTLPHHGITEIVPEQAAQKFQDREQKPSARLPRVAEMTKGMRIGNFLRIDPAISQTDATHQQGNLITLSDTDVPGMLRDPEFAKLVDESSLDPQALQADALSAAFSKIEAVTYETKAEITIDFP